jgi:hypothetical protein
LFEEDSSAAQCKKAKKRHGNQARAALLPSLNFPRGGERLLIFDFWVLFLRKDLFIVLGAVASRPSWWLRVLVSGSKGQLG